MSLRACWLTAWILSCILCGAPLTATETAPPLGVKIDDFTLPNPAANTDWTLGQEARQAPATVVVFLGTECPVSNAYLPTLNALYTKYVTRGVTFVGINANAQDSLEEIAQHTQTNELKFPVLRDPTGAVAARLSAQRQATAYVLDGTRKVRYQGRIDDQFERGQKRVQATQHDLENALESVLAGKEVAVPYTTITACPINRPDQRKAPQSGDSVVTYTRDVAAILQTKCQACHRPGEVGPFHLMNYEDALAWSDAIGEVVQAKLMPPWHADPHHGEFANDRRLTDAETRTLLTWIQTGCAQGDPADLPPPREYTQGWNIGQPDEVIAMNESFAVPAQTPPGGVPYQFILAGAPFTEERWVQAAEVRPGAREVVHHVIVHVVGPGVDLEAALKSDGLDEILGLLAYVPGDQAFVLPSGYAKRIPKGARLLFEMHYTPNGKAVEDRSSLGLIYAKEPPLHEVKVDCTVNTDLVIPPHASAHTLDATHLFRQDVLLRSLNPHMHVRGKSFEYRLTLPNGQEEILLSVPRYDFNWQHTYVLAKPKHVPKGSKLRTVAVYDNSKENPFNPDPTREVRWGEQTWDEMLLGSFEYFLAPQSDAGNSP